MGVHTAINNISKAYNLDIIPINKNSNDLIISIGSGMLMATMDLLPKCGYAFEFTQKMSKSNMEDSFALLSLYVNNIYITAWFSISKPVSLIKSLECCKKEKVNYYSNIELFGNRFFTLKELEKIYNFNNYGIR